MQEKIKIQETIEKAADTEMTFLRGAKWKQEKMYSEEEVKQMLIDFCAEVSCEDGILVGKTPEELCKYIDEQFKK